MVAGAFWKGKGDVGVRVRRTRLYGVEKMTGMC